jgi:four helix bundle protein
MEYDIEPRLIEFAFLISRIFDAMPADKFASLMANQLIRSGTSPALNYAEAQAAESPKDFIHKMKLCLKELRETFVSLKIIKRRGRKFEQNILEAVLKENNELISIFVASIKTARKNKDAKKRQQRQSNTRRPSKKATSDEES